MVNCTELEMGYYCYSRCQSCKLYYSGPSSDWGPWACVPHAHRVKTEPVLRASDQNVFFRSRLRRHQYTPRRFPPSVFCFSSSTTRHMPVSSRHSVSLGPGSRFARRTWLIRASVGLTRHPHTRDRWDRRVHGRRTGRQVVHALCFDRAIIIV